MRSLLHRSKSRVGNLFDIGTGSFSIAKGGCTLYFRTLPRDAEGMKTISHILILVLIVSMYFSYCQWRCSHYYVLSAAMEKKGDWQRTVHFAAKAAKANPLDDKPLHLVSKALLEQGHLEPAILIIKKVLRVRPHKKYLLHNLKLGVNKFKALQRKK